MPEVRLQNVRAPGREAGGAVGEVISPHAAETLVETELGYLVGVHAAFALYYCAFVALSAITSVWVAEISPRRAGPAIVLVCGGRNAISFGIR